MRQLSPDMDLAVVRQVDDRLAAIAEENAVSVPWAVESGSRAWGFPSPDSDYDCRFFFVRPAAAYLDPWQPRDVIETPLVGLLDVNGWDLMKAVRLATRGNATVGEWLRSPLVYAGDPAFRDDLLALVDEVVDRPGLVRHYLHVGRDHWARSGAASGAEVVLKRVFYALRPAAALHWMAHHDEGVPPMNLDELLDEAAPPDDVRAAVTDLVAAKAVTRELGDGVVPPVLGGWVQEQLVAAEAAGEALQREDRERAADGFRRLLGRWAPSGR